MRSEFFSTQSEQPFPTVRAMVAKAGSVQKKPAMMQKATKKPVRKEGKTSKVQRGRLHACVAYSTEVLQTPLQVMGLHKEDHVVAHKGHSASKVKRGVGCDTCPMPHAASQPLVMGDAAGCFLNGTKQLLACLSCRLLRKSCESFGLHSVLYTVANFFLA